MTRSGRALDTPGDSLGRVVEALIRSPGLTRAELGMRVGLTRAPVAVALAALSERGFLEQRVEPERVGESRGLGRPPLRIYLAGKAGYAIALDVGKASLRGGLFDLMGEQLRTGERTAAAGDGPRAVLEAATDLVAELLGAAADPERVMGIGVALAAPLGFDGSVVANGTHEDWIGFDFAGALEARVELPVLVENDANAGALGEHRFGAGRGCDDLLYVRLSAGVGVGLILGGHLYRGGGGIAGELGHISIRDDGPLCTCGNRGCIEAVAGPDAVAADVGASVREMIALAADGDRRARRVLADAGETIGQGLAAAINLLNPRRIVVGGDLAAAGELMTGPMEAAIERRAIAAGTSAAPLVLGELGARAELLGAATLHLPTLAGRLVQRLGVS